MWPPRVEEMFGTKKSSTSVGPRGSRAYAIGDIHGRLDLLDRLLNKIEDDLKSRPAKRSFLIVLGDIIDRGPQSAAVIERLMTYATPGITKILLLGNHEEVLLRVLAGDGATARNWLRFGGAECLGSYGVDVLDLEWQSDEELVETARGAIPESHIKFLQSFVDTCRFGDYLFVHAGIRPGVELSDQDQSDLRWIRDPFLLDTTDHGFIVVHGHTIRTRVEERQNRIGIDTGAYKTGVLTALVVEESERRYIDTR